MPLPISDLRRISRRFRAMTSLQLNFLLFFIQPRIWRCFSCTNWL